MTDENLASYTVSRIFERIDRDYLEFIIRKSSEPVNQQKLTVTKASISPEEARKAITNGIDFENRFNSLSADAKKFYMSLYSMGRVWRRLGDQSGKDGHVLKQEVHECMDKLMVFGIPSRSNPVDIIIPVDYAILSDFLTVGRNDPVLVNPLRDYPMELLKKIGRYYGIPSNMTKVYAATEIYLKIVGNLHENLKNLGSGERKIMDYLMTSDGVTGFNHLIEKFNMGKGTSYYDNVGFHNLFSTSSYSRGDYLVSLMTKGLLFCTRGKYYGSLESIYIPDEVVMELRKIIKDEKNLTIHGKDQKTEAVQPKMKNYGVNYASQIKAVLLVVYYLEQRSKKRHADAIGKFLSIPERDLNFTLEYAKVKGWINGKTSNLGITPVGFSFIEDRNFQSNLKQNIFQERVFTAWKDRTQGGTYYLDRLRELFLETVHRMRHPENIGNVTEEMKDGDDYFKLSRNLRFSLMESRSYSQYSETLIYLRKDMEEKMEGWILELVEFLKIYGLLATSSPEVNNGTYIFPESELIDLIEKKGRTDFGISGENIQKPLKILPNNEILVETGADFRDLKTLSDFTDLISADRLCTFLITKSSISAYMNRSEKVENILPFLRKKSSVPVPDTMERLIKDMEKKENDISITKCQAILQVSDSTVIDGIMSINTVSGMIEKRITPEILILKEDASLYRFVTEIRKKGYIVPITVEKEKRTRSVWDRW